MSVTIKEIAEIAGVHRATVDKVLHGRAGVSDEVRQRIQKIIEEMGYIPNPAGRVLQRQGRVYQIAVILTQVDALPYLREGIRQGVEKQAGFTIETKFDVTSFQDTEAQLQALDRAITQQADGIILNPIHSRRIRAAIDRAADAGIPVITVNSDIDSARRFCYVGMDSARASRIAGRLMGQLVGGCGKVAIISSAMDAENNNYYVSVREQGFCDFIGTVYKDIQIVERLESFEDPHITYQKTRTLLERYPLLRGIYITCGGVSEVGRALQESGRYQDIRVLSYEDYPPILELLRLGVIDCTLASGLTLQGKLPVQLMMDYLIFNRKPPQPQLFLDTKVLVKECVF